MLNISGLRDQPSRRTALTRSLATLMAALFIVAGQFAGTGPSVAQPSDSPGTETSEPSTAGKSEAAEASKTEGLKLELNKLEPQGDKCRAYIVIRNQSGRHYESFKLDLIEFQTDGIIGHRFAIDLGPIRPEKTLVKLFDIADTACEEIGSFLINDIMECSTDSGTLDDCFSGLSVSSRTSADITK